MKPKDYMKQAYILRNRINRKRREAEDIRIRESVPSSSSLSDMPRSTSHNPHQKSNNILRAIELDEEANAAFEELEKLKGDFMLFINQIDNPDNRDLIYKRYIEFKKWEIVAKELGYSESHTKRIYGSILKKMILNDTQ